MHSERRRKGIGPALLIGAALSLLVHVPLAWWFLQNTFFNDSIPPQSEPVRVSFLRVSPPEEEPEEEDEEEEDEEVDGQIVEIAPPEDPKKPEEADYLAEYDSTVPEETVDPRFRNDREVIAETFSPDDSVELADEVDIDAEQPSTGSVAGNERFRLGDFSLYPSRQSPWDVTSLDGLTAPARSRRGQTEVAGSPSNDWLPDVNHTDRTALNAHEFLFASFWNRVKQLVSFYADQTLANANPSVPLRKPRYEVKLTGLISLDGEMEALEVQSGSGIPEFDEAIKEAFHLAAPFPDPPAAAAEDDGYIHMRNFSFVITIGAARAELSGIDPRQGIQFPGLQTIPR